MKPQKVITIEIDVKDFESRYEKNEVTGCWNWLKPGKDRGYGSYKGYPAHRVAWLVYKEQEPNGNYVLHTCDNRRCVNTDHLYLGNQSDNLHDMWSRGRRKHNGGAAKHGWKKVNKIRELYATGDYSLAALGRQFGMNRSLVYKIVNNHIWKP